MSPLDLYLADKALEADIQAILNNSGLRKKEKRKLLKALQDQSCNAYLRSHVQYYMDSLQVKPYEVFLSAISVCIVTVFAAYTVIRLFQVL